MKIKFSCDPNLVDAIPHPIKASRAIPEYYKSIKPQVGSLLSDGTVKRCIPFLEALSVGYIIPLWSDIHIIAKDGFITTRLPVHFQQAEGIGCHPISQFPNHPMSGRPYGTIFLKLINPWIVETQPGFSCLFTSPLNHFETRLKIFDGIVDTDKFYFNVHFPFMWTGGDGEFLLERGTPIAHVIPFKRTESKIDIGAIDQKRKNSVLAKIGTLMNNSYKTDFWHKNAKEDPSWVQKLKFWK